MSTFTVTPTDSDTDADDASIMVPVESFRQWREDIATINIALRDVVNPELVAVLDRVRGSMTIASLVATVVVEA